MTFWSNILYCSVLDDSGEVAKVEELVNANGRSWTGVIREGVMGHVGNPRDCAVELHELINAVARPEDDNKGWGRSGFVFGMASSWRARLTMKDNNERVEGRVAVSL